MNKRAKQRLIGVTLLILVVVGVLIVASGVLTSGAEGVTISEVADNAEYVGKRVTVTGTVVAGSWVAGSEPFVFDIEDGKESDSPRLRIVSAKQVPGSFGDGTTAIVTGLVADDGSVEAETISMQCPSKYESASGALTVSDVLNRARELEGTTLKVAGYVAAGSIQPAGSTPRFSIIESTQSDRNLPVVFGGGLSEDVIDGAEVVITGSIEADGTFLAAEVALEGAPE